MHIEDEAQLVGLALALAGRGPLRLGDDEEKLVAGASSPPQAQVFAARTAIKNGLDPLGEAFCALRSPADRRPRGATYTPLAIVESMLAWAARSGSPARVVDPGAGSGRFLARAGRTFPGAQLVAVELDPLAALLARCHLAACGMGDRAIVHVGDYRSVALGRISGPTLFIGNPPYVRHHDIAPEWKRWLSATAARRGVRASQLAGLHVHFFLATLEHASAGDFGAFITAAEWLDVNYGSTLRRLFVDGLGGLSLHVIEPTANAFPDAQATAAISCFRIGSRPTSVLVRRVSGLEELGALDRGKQVATSRLDAAARWTPLTRARRAAPGGFVELGEICRVRRGQVTGANGFWIAGPHARDLPDSYLRPTVTRAKELLSSGLRLEDSSRLRRAIDLPEDLDELLPEHRKAVEAFLRRGHAAGVQNGYIASHRRAWWAVGLHEPAPVLATYMARRPPAFVINAVHARHLNIAHGLYPLVDLTDAQLAALARHLGSTASVADGRTYAGGLTKFEPKEMERLLVPAPEMLGSPR